MASSPTLDEQAKIEWRNHEHVTDELITQARRLLQAAGSLEHAHYALDSAAENQLDLPPGTSFPVSMARHEDFARQCGYATYAEMSHFAEPIGDAEDKDWYLTPIQGGNWVIWNDCDCEIEQRLCSYEEAASCFHAYRT